ncbi:hypothetical protein BH24ACI1_BH24ACI1_18080 [soil metagenome]|jgi:hypothetical protein
MEKKLITNFSSERTFDIYDADASYHFLLVRSSGGMHDVNIDLIFGGVLYIELPSLLFGVKVTKPCDEKSVELEKRYTTYQSANYEGEYVYSIESGSTRFNVVASALWIHVNSLPTSSLIPMCEDTNEKEDYYAKYLKEEYTLG